MAFAGLNRFRRLFTKGRGDWTPLELAARICLRQDHAGVVSVGEVPHERFPVTLPQPSELTEHSWQTGELTVRVFEDVVFWPCNGGVRTGADPGRIISGLGHGDDKLDTAVAWRCFPRYREIREDRPCCCISHVNRNFYHRFTDAIPRVFTLHQAPLRARPAIALYVDDRFTADEMSLLRSLLPGNVEVVACDKYCRVRAREYIHLPLLNGRRTNDLPAWQADSAGYLPAAYLEWYRRHAAKHFGVEGHGPARRQVFVSRAGANIRRLTNEAEVVAALEPLGFEVVQLESMSLGAQVALFHEARVVVAQHGAGLTNLFYMQPGGTVIELMSSAHKLKHYSLLAQNLGLRHEFLCGDGKEKNDDASVDVQKLLSALHVTEASGSMPPVAVGLV